ncbi:MAG: tyrosine--tRNA ligase, partial [Candidatus Cloacimonetes bacterium]|nr:tyrosine--tRNA ligase [Candidatus Cloacimonadota bacterium]
QLKEGKINPKIIKQRLAREIVSLYHGEKEAQKAEEEFNQVFSKKEIPDEMPEYKMKEDKISIMDILVRNKICSSNGEVKRMIKQNAVSINGKKINDIFYEINDSVVIKVGKRRFLKVVK